jgi:hypothetical protein
MPYAISNHFKLTLFHAKDYREARFILGVLI